LHIQRGHARRPLQPAQAAPPPEGAIDREDVVEYWRNRYPDYGLRWEFLPTTFEAIQQQPDDLYEILISWGKEEYADTIRLAYGKKLKEPDVCWVTPVEASAFQYEDTYLAGGCCRSSC
jgi:hypothetical protein